ncbi:YMGG-like glycine zipper-containing protein [Roseisolibacter agri]|nr:YMGG-like glycine zipper-containing protein [Roseisolibacter agri]
MRSAPRRPAAVALLLALAAVGACGRDDAPAPDADSALARDLTLATAPVPPRRDSLALGDTAVVAETPPAPVVAAPEPAPARRAPARVASAPTPRAVETRPAPTPAPVAPPVAAAPRAEKPAEEPAPTPVRPASDAGSGPSLGRGTLLAGTTGSRICSTSNRPGDRLVATLAADVTGADGVVLPAGTGVVLEVASVSREGKVELLARGVSLNGAFHPIVADVAVGEAPLEKRTVAGTNDTKGKAVKGAIAGAIIGQILGRDTKGTIIGAATGAAAGAAAGQLGKKEELCLAAGAPVRVTIR